MPDETVPIPIEKEPSEGAYANGPIAVDIAPSAVAIKPIALEVSPFARAIAPNACAPSPDAMACTPIAAECAPEASELSPIATLEAPMSESLSLPKEIGKLPVGFSLVTYRSKFNHSNGFQIGAESGPSETNKLPC